MECRLSKACCEGETCNLDWSSLLTGFASVWFIRFEKHDGVSLFIQISEEDRTVSVLGFLQTNVDGVYNIPPDEPGAQLLRHIQILEGKALICLKATMPCG